LEVKLFYVGERRLLKRIFSGIIVLTMMLTGMLTLAFNIQPVRAEPAIIIVPDDYPTIQEAINHANEEDTIFVRNGIYYENVVVNKSVSLIGENKETTFIDGGGNDTVLEVTANDVTISNFTIQHSGGEWADSGIDLRYSTNSHVVNNNILNNYFGIELGYNNTLTQNYVFNNQWGIRDYGGGNHVLIGNDVYSNRGYGIYLYESGNTILIRNNVRKNEGTGISLEYSGNSALVSNVIYSNNGNGIYLGWSSDSNLTSNNISENFRGIELFDSPSSTLLNNIVSNNEYEGIRLAFSHGSIVKGNNMSSNKYNFGVYDWTLLGYFLDIDTSNLVNGKPIYYMINQKDIVVEPTNFSNVGYLAFINSTNITVRNHIFENNSQGLLLAYTSNTLVENVKAINNKEGVYLWHSNDNVLSGSNVLDNEYGIYFHSSKSNALVENAIGNNTKGIYTSQSTYSSIIGNIVYSNKYGIHLYWSPRSNVTDNNFLSNEYGIYLEDLSINNIFHNNFLGNIYQVSISGRSYDNVWDDGYPSGGNYWSDYNGTDLYSGPYQNETGSDGIGDTPYVIDENNADRYPLMGPFNSFNISVGYSVDVISNSTVEDFQYFESNRTIVMHVSNVTADQTVGFCRLTIPHELIAPPYNITVNNTPVEYNTILENETLSIVYFSYEHSQIEIIIVPEFPSIILLLAIIFAMFVIILAKRKIPENPNQ